MDMWFFPSFLPIREMDAYRGDLGFSVKRRRKICVVSWDHLGPQPILGFEITSIYVKLDIN
jgi:hypothetical protein